MVQVIENAVCLVGLLLSFTPDADWPQGMRARLEVQQVAATGGLPDLVHAVPGQVVDIRLPAAVAQASSGLAAGARVRATVMLKGPGLVVAREVVREP